MPKHTGRASPDVSIVIVTYNNEHCIGPCLSSLVAALSGRAFEIVVVDNNSADGSRDVIRAFPGVKMIANSTNVGFAAAVNQGLRLAAANTFLLLNSDVLIGGPALQGLLDACRQNGEKGLFAPSIVNPDGSPQPTALGKFPTFWVLASELLLPYAVSRRLGLKTLFGNRSQNGWDYDWLSGACLAFTREAYARIGPFDERFFMYYEDVDFCRRAMDKQIVPTLLGTVTVLHSGGQSFSYRNGSSDRQRYVRDSLLAYIAKHETRPAVAVLRLFLAIGDLLRRGQRQLADWGRRSGTRCRGRGCDRRVPEKK